MTFRYAYLFVTLLVTIFFIETTSAIECNSIPTDGCTVTHNTIFIQNNYSLPRGITINENNVFLDCSNSILDGEHSFQNGITIFQKKNVTIKNCNIQNYERANLLVRESEEAKIENSRLENSEWNYGINIYHSTKAELKNNSLRSNRVNLYIEATEKQDYDHLVDKTNTVNSKPVIYLFDAKNLAINTLDLGHLEINFGENISIVNNQIAGDGILLNNVINSFVSSNIISKSDVGLDLQHSEGIKSIRNEIYNNGLGIRVQESDNNLFLDNSITSSNYEGLSLFEANNNLIKNNEIISSKYYNLRIISSSNNRFSDNTKQETAEF